MFTARASQRAFGGFLNGQDDSALLALLQGSASGVGLFAESQNQNLTLGKPILTRDATTEKFTRVTGIEQSPDLVTPFAPVIEIDPTFDPETGEIAVEFNPPAANAYFYRVFGKGM